MRREKQEERSVLEFGRIGIWKLRAIIRLQFQWDYFSKEMGTKLDRKGGWKNCGVDSNRPGP